MKKRLVVALTLIMILVFVMGSLVGCDEIFKRNEERDAKQIVATVTYGNQVAHVTKGELASSFNAYAYSYVYYYGMTYQQAADYIVKSLAQRELLVLFAKEYILGEYVKQGLLPAGSTPEETEIEALLTRSEINRAVENTNHDMLHSLSSIIDGLFTDDAYNEGKVDEEDETVEVTDPVKVKFETFDGSAVETQKIQKGTKAKEPTAPTLANKSFYGWYEDEECTVKFDFGTKVEESITLYAKWVDYRAPRAEMPEEVEEDDYDADNNHESVAIEHKFFDAEFIKSIKDKEEELEIESNIADEDFNQYIDRGIAKLKEQLASTYRDYDYYLESQMKTLLVEKLERYIGKAVEVEKEAVEARFAKLVQDNRETFGGSDTAFASALSSARATTYFHQVTVDENNSGYGYVVNILLKMSQDDIDYLTDMVKAGNVEDEIIRAERDRLVGEMMISVSNPDYDADAEVDYNGDDKVDSLDKDIAEKMVDPMTDPSNPYNVAGTQYNAENDYNNLVKFGKNEAGEWEITYGAKECPTMAYLLDEVPAFSDENGTVIGIVDQIYNSFEAVKQAAVDGEMTHVESIYWLNKVATAWVYLVGDDTGMTTESSNNGGLGYLITPDGEDSNYLENFTTLARGIIKNGTGAYSVDGTATEGNFYTIADSFIDNGNTSNAYAGIFVLLCSYKAWDNTAYGIVENEDGTFSEELVTLETDADGAGILPMNYIVSYGKTLEDCVTVGEQVRSALEAGIKSDKYTQVANEFGVINTDNIEYFEKVYKSLWSNLD